MGLSCCVRRRVGYACPPAGLEGDGRFQPIDRRRCAASGVRGAAEPAQPQDVIKCPRHQRAAAVRSRVSQRCPHNRLVIPFACCARLVLQGLAGASAQAMGVAHGVVSRGGGRRSSHIPPGSSSFPARCASLFARLLRAGVWVCAVFLRPTEWARMGRWGGGPALIGGGFGAAAAAAFGRLCVSAARWSSVAGRVSRRLWVVDWLTI